MNLTSLAVLAIGSSFGQAPAPAANAEVRFVNKRTLAIPVSLPASRIKELEKVSLFVSRDNGDTYELHQSIKPLESSFTLSAREDGVYWVQVQENFLNGNNAPKNPREIPPAEKLVIDTVAPIVSITKADMQDGEVRLEWRIDDKHPADATTKIYYMPSGADFKEAKSWREVPANSISKRTARFKSEVPGPIVVQVATADLALNVGAENREIGLKATAPIVNTSATSPSLAEPLPMPKDPGIPAPATTMSLPLDKEPLNTSAAMPASTSSSGFAPTASAASTGALPIGDSSKPIAMGSGLGNTSLMPTSAPAAAPVEPSPGQMSRSPRFDLNYTLDGGPSGVARVDLYVTRDDGRNWVRWSTHDGRETPLKVVLDMRFNKDVEGDYGLMLVPVSGAGLSEGAPTANTAPELRVRIDTTAPVIKVYQPKADPNNKNALVLQWEATDRNFGKDPIAIEFSEDPRGPWKSVSGEAAPATTAATVAAPARLENTGSYSWAPPMNLTTPKVYLRFTAWDTAGNKSEVVTPNPILVDLTKPKARIQGISPTMPGR